MQSPITRNLATTLAYYCGLSAFAAITASVSGCGSDPSSKEESFDRTEQDALGTNALGTNALGTNALGTNALGTNALGTNALGTNALGTNALGTNGVNWLNEAGAPKADRVKLLRYLVKCALSSSQYVKVSAADAGQRTDENLPGLYGLAPNWLMQGMSELDQRWVTSCVLAHVNTKERQQRIALHGSHSAFVASAAEKATMYSSEGRYWGNIFQTTLAKNVCSSGGRNTGYNSPKNFDIILGRSCADDGCGVMTSNGRCPIAAISPTEYNNWFNLDRNYGLNGYDSYGYVYQPISSGSTTPNSNGLFPAIEVAGPASQEIEGLNGNVSAINTCIGNYAYNDGIASATFADTSAGTEMPVVADCTSSSRCSGIDLQNHPNGQKIRNIPSGTRLRYAFMTAQPVGSQQFYLRLRYSAVGSNVRARVSVNGSPLVTVTFAPTGANWDTYDTMFWAVPFASSPASLKSVACGNGYNPNNIPYAAYMEIESVPGSTFPDLDAVWIEP